MKTPAIRGRKPPLLNLNHNTSRPPFLLLFEHLFSSSQTLATRYYSFLANQIGSRIVDLDVACFEQIAKRAVERKLRFHSIGTLRHGDQNARRIDLRDGEDRATLRAACE